MKKLVVENFQGKSITSYSVCKILSIPECKQRAVEHQLRVSMLLQYK